MKSIKMTIYTHPKTTKSSKYVSIKNKFELPEFAQLDPSRNASEPRFVGVTQTLQNKWKSIKMIIYTHAKTPKSSKYVTIINKFEPPEFAQLDPSQNGSEARFLGVSQTLQNKWKSTKMTIYTHPKTQNSLHICFISKF